MKVYEALLPELRRDTVYLDASKLAFSAYLAHATLAHEFQHLIHWGRDSDEEAWIDEGLSGYAEESGGFSRGRSEHGAEFSRGSQPSI